MKEKQRERVSFPHSRNQLCLHCDDLGLMERPEWGVRIRDPEPNMVWICCMLPDMSIFLVRDLQGHLAEERDSFPCDAEWQLLTGPIGQGDWEQRIALAYSGTHYDAVCLPFGSWDALQESAGS